MDLESNFIKPIHIALQELSPVRSTYYLMCALPPVVPCLQSLKISFKSDCNQLTYEPLQLDSL